MRRIEHKSFEMGVRRRKYFSGRVSYFAVIRLCARLDSSLGGIMPDEYRKYSGEKIDVEFSLKRCIHAAECVRGAVKVFNPTQKPWIQVDNADADTVAEVVERCPTGALRHTRKDGGAAEQPDPEPTVKVVKDGPLYLRGTIEIELADRVEQGTRVALCRCGHSENKPLCDGAHVKCEFKDDGQVGTGDFKDIESASGVNVSFIPNGPIIVRGRATLIDVEDTAVMRDDECYLCRCGASANKPFCDGSHARVGFKDA